MLKHERQPGEATTWSEFVAQRQAKDDGRGEAAGPQGDTGAAGQLPKAARKREGLAVAKKKLGGRKGILPGDSPHGNLSRGGAVADAPGGTKGGPQTKDTISTKEDVDWLTGLLGTKGAAAKGALSTKPVKTLKPNLANGTRAKLSASPKNSAKKGPPSGTRPMPDPEGRKDGFPVKRATPATTADVVSDLGGNEAVPSHTERAQHPFKKRASKVKRPAANNETAHTAKRQGVSVSDETSETRVDGKQLASGGAKTASKRPAQAAREEEASSAEGEEEGAAPARNKRPRASPAQGGGSKAGGRLQRLRQERESKGLLLLPEKVERRIYQAKRAMRKKGLPGEEIKQAVRKMRRKEELLFRKQLAKLCFKCRQPGHKVSDCPQVLQNPDEAVGICFKCGSTEHFSSACHVQTSKDNEFPYAKCFICKQQGHISRKCPRNDKGVYPKGGHCSFCGGIDHFKRECPEMEKNKKKNAGGGEEFAGDIASIDQSADAENVPALQPLSQGKKAKVVSF